MLTFPGLATTVYDRTMLYNQLFALVLGNVTRGDIIHLYIYDSSGRISVIDTTIADFHINVTMTYDTTGRLTRVIVTIAALPPDFPNEISTVIDYTYDSNGRLERVDQVES